MTASGEMSRLSLESLAKRYEGLSHAKNPVGWVKNVLKQFAWSKQQEILQSVVDNQYTAVQACHGVGKSFIAAAAVAWWISTHPIGQTYVITTAPTARQVEAVLWKEIRRCHALTQLPAGSRITSNNGQPMWKNADGTELGMGRKPADQDAHGFQGVHDKWLLIVIDEACGIAPLIYTAVDSMVTSRENRVLAIGNPDDPNTQFAQNCDLLNPPGALWHTIRIDALASPNMNEAACEEYPELRHILAEAGLEPSTEHVPESVAENIVSPGFVVRAAKSWGTTSSLWTSKVRGLFPTGVNGNEVIPLAWVEAAMRRWEVWNEGTPQMRDGKPTGQWQVEPREALAGFPIISCDVSGSGEDSTAIGFRHGRCLVDIQIKPGADTTTEIYKRLITFNGATTLDMPGLEFIVDFNGLGEGVYYRLNEHMDNWRVPIKPFVQAYVSQWSGADKRDNLGVHAFDNYRSWSWWRMRELLSPDQRGDSAIMLPPNDKLKRDLTIPTYKVSDKGAPPRIIVEKKDEIRKRLGSSPDAGDMCVMAFTAVASPKPTPAVASDIHAWGERMPSPYGQPSYRWATVEGSSFNDMDSSGFGGVDGTL